MKSVITFLIPGLGQLFSGDARKGGIMFLSAVIAGVLTSGPGYFVCGAWSVLDMQFRASSSRGKSEIGTLLGTSEVPKQAAGSGGVQAVMPWVFKFSVLGLCGFLALNNIRGGGALQSLEMFGVRLHFASLASEAGAAAANGGNLDTVSDQPSLDAVANALISDPRQGTGNQSEKISAPDPAGYPNELGNDPYGNEAASESLSSFAGQWNSDLGATYQISESGGTVQITETSRILFVPFISMTCTGQSAGSYIRAECTTYDKQTGELVLARDAIGGLGGVFTAYANGMQIPLNLRR